MVENLVIIGSGPSGHTAAIYAARANLKPVLFEGFYAGGVAPGGQLTTTTDVENFPGFPEGIDGQKICENFRNQSLRFGVEIYTETVTDIDLTIKPFIVKTDQRTVEAKSIIVATGATAKRLNVKGEDHLWQKGISACAVCDGALPLFRNQPLVVVGGGDSAIEEATHLTKFGSKVYLIHRRNELRASKIMQHRVLNHEKIEVVWDSVVVEAKGEQSLNAVVIKNVKNGEEKEISCSGLFYAVGHIPNTDFLKGQVNCDETGYIITKDNSTKTSVPGVFACGDVQDKVWRQAITAAGTGCMAALEAENFLTHE